MNYTLIFEFGYANNEGVIHSIHYHRLILDEAHSIKQRTTSVARACFALKSNYKWCLSGTPVQNRIGEFFSLLRFLEVRPFACYFCKVCSCRELHWSQDSEKRCTTCKHRYSVFSSFMAPMLDLTSRNRGFDHVSVFNQEILNPSKYDLRIIYSIANEISYRKKQHRIAKGSIGETSPNYRQDHA